MGIYEVLQLNAEGSKKIIRESKGKKEKTKQIMLYILKVLLTTLFCTIVVTAFTLILGSKNSIVGVIAVLSILVLRKADLGIKTTHGIFGIFVIYGILIVGPRLSNAVSPMWALIINAGCILTIMTMGCHNVIMSNQSTFLLSYLLLIGYDVTGKTFAIRAIGLMVAAIISALVFYKNHRKQKYTRTLKNLFSEFDIHTTRTQWYLKMTFAVATALFIASIFKFPRIMWIGIAIMSTLQPFEKDIAFKVKRRLPGNIIGSLAFLALFVLVPESLRPLIGLIGGIGVGFSATYSWQTIFNTLGAIMIATTTFGLKEAIILRIFANLVGSIYVVIFDKTSRILFKHILNNEKQLEANSCS